MPSLCKNWMVSLVIYGLSAVAVIWGVGLMALIGVAFGLGFILGPVIGAFSAQFFGLQGPGSILLMPCPAWAPIRCGR